MAEIILPPEENEETPQVPELNIDKPSGNSKVITIEFEAKKTNKVSTKDTNQQLYTTDTDAWFEFKETSLEGANGTYSVVFRNRHDGSIFQRTGDVVNGVAYYKIPHQEIRHAGKWRGQLVYTLENGNTTAREFDYDVKGHILDGKDVREIVVEDFETLMSQLKSMKDNAEQELANLTQELRSTTDTAEQNETDRQAFFDDLVEDIDELQTNYQELLDTGVLQTNINEKLEELEEEYAPKLTEVTAQLAQKANEAEMLEQLNTKRDKDMPIGLNDTTSDLLAAIQNKEGETSFNLLSEPRPHSVTPITTTFISQSSNLFNKENVVLGKRISSDGTVTNNTSFGHTTPINVKHFPNLTTSGIYEVAFYDESDNFISRQDAVPSEISKKTFTVPKESYFARANFSLNSKFWARGEIQINKGAELLPYEDYYQRFEGVDIKTEDVVGKYSGYDIDDGTIPPKKTTFISQSTNLFNKNHYTANKRIGPDGSLNDHNGYAVSSPFNFNSEYQLTALGVNEIAFYDKNDIFISREKVPNFSEPHTYTPPKEARIGRANFSLNSKFWARGEIQINKGAELLPYEEHQSTFALSSGLEKLNSILLDDFITKDDSYMIDVPIDGVFQTQKTFPDYTNFRESTHTDIYGMMDTLMDAYPEYITSEVIGYDVLDNEIKMYRLNPERPPADKKTKMPKVFLTTGTHGPEKATVPSTYHMLKMMCEEWKNYPLLEALRFNVEWLYIPVVNPSGWNARTRDNANGVDINRNFPFQWTLAHEGTGTYSGPAPLSEPETRAVNSIFESNPDIDIFCDFHNFGPETVPVEDGKFSGKNRFLWLLTDDIPYVQNMGQSLIGRLGRRWEDDFEWYANGQFAGHTGAINGGPGMMQSYAQSLGTIRFSSTLEICNTWAINPDGVSNGDDVIKAGVEAITNWILIQLKELIK